MAHSVRHMAPRDKSEPTNLYIPVDVKKAGIRPVELERQAHSPRAVTFQEIAVILRKAVARARQDGVESVLGHGRNGAPEEGGRDPGARF